MEKLRVTNGVYWVSIPEADLSILCGCPADSVKHLMKSGLIVEKDKNGAVAQTGPNAILLSDTNIQKGSFSNLAEFPVLQMLYLQGMILPGHPNNTGRKPMLIGLEDQVRSQSGYIYRGTYGLGSLEEITASGVPEGLARDMLRIKRWFAFDNIRRTEDLMDLRIVDRPAVELRGGAFVRRRGFNRYQFIHAGKSVTVDLNLGDGEEYLPTYSLGFHRLHREYFSVVHIGEGDGWDVSRPCMASILCFQGRIFLIDAGPNIAHSLTALGVGINEIDGIFHTHAHDDHFAGLTSLAGRDHRIRYYATPPVRASVVKKYAALTGRSEESFAEYFDARDLAFDLWNPVEGLEVMPVFSPHPVETSVLFFRTLWEGGYKSYAHLADISSFEVLRKMVSGDPASNGISQAFYDSCTRALLQPADIKKIDIGGGLIHGRAEDFAGDTSGRLVLAHTSVPLTDSQKEIGSGTAFAQDDVLIPTHCDYLLLSGRDCLREHFPGAQAHDIAMLANCPLASFAPDALILRAEAPVKDIYLLLSGLVELIDSKTGTRNRLTAGALIGELAGFTGEISHRTFRAASHVAALRIPCEMYVEFIRRGNLSETIRQAYEHRQFLQGTWLFGEMVSFTVQNRIAWVMEKRSVREGERLLPGGRPEILLLAEGLVTVFSGSRPIENLTPGGVSGEDTVLAGLDVGPNGAAARPDGASSANGASGIFESRALHDSTLYAIPGDALSGIPIVRWKLRETHERRLRSLHTEFRFEWREAYGMGIPDLDREHAAFFETIGGLDAVAAGRRPPSAAPEAIEKILVLATAHLQAEEARLRGRGLPQADSLAREHGEFLKKVEGFQKFIENAPATALRTTIDYLKDWALDHALLENRRDRDHLGA
ncbi:MAG: cyclic nucleotide-binding domain-containing protein [Acidobacteria bacterium]|nr:cyclic nucleotide-binding domain-containing protein [Spirochaetota bacterium]MBE3134008.1 cyclic nucleotide-binding domain-containing protein [Acidobacteriota bacterium]